MHWWKMWILFFLSSFIYFSCESKQQEKKLVEENPDWSSKIVQHFVDTEKIEVETMDSLIGQLNINQDSMIGYSKNNSIDSGKWLITSSEERTFNHLKILLQKDENHEFFETPLLNLWRIRNKQGKLLKEISISPHPTKGFVLIMRERGQE